ncbi:unnamed protein product, partial [Rotaria sordida]
DNEDIQFVFTVVLPKQGVLFDEVEQKLALKPDLMQKILSNQNARTEKLHLYLPKFKMEAVFQLNGVLIQLGMVNVFNDTEADFRGIINKQDDRSAYS